MSEPSLNRWRQIIRRLKRTRVAVAGDLIADEFIYGRVERVSRLHAEIREQRDAIAVLRSEWAKLDAPLRLQGLADRHLPLKPINANQYDQLKNLPERPPTLVQPGEQDPIGAMINAIDTVAKAPDATGSVTQPEDKQ